jgi:ABC-type multidrug transport system ATPase subunit
MLKQGSARKIQLLNNVTGAFRPGVLSALMGVSGAGKTTLLDVLAGRKTGGYIEGDIRIGGHTKVQETFVRILGYCEQVDIHSPQLTVEESVAYSAWLRLPSEVDEKTRSVRPLEHHNNYENNRCEKKIIEGFFSNWRSFHFELICRNLWMKSSKLLS